MDIGTMTVLLVLRNPKYVWRSVAGLAKHTGLSDYTVREILEELADHPIVRHNATTGMYALTDRIPAQSPSSAPTPPDDEP